VIFSLLAACYGSAPPPPAKIPLPPIVDGAEIDVRSRQVTTVEQVQKQAKTCSEATPDPQHCTTTSYSEAEPVTRTHTSATYAGTPINYAQLRVLGDAHYDEKLARLEELSHVCRRANVPRYLGLAGLLGGLVLATAASSYHAPALNIAAAGAAAGGIASYAAGYYAFGGRDCVEARRLYNEVNVADRTGWVDVIGEGYADEMRTLADQFNTTHARRSALQMRR
jgi:hypothetical protein